MGAMLSQITALLAAEKTRLWHSLSRSLLGAILALFTALAALEGLAMVLVGGYASLKRTMQPWEAGLIVGGVLIVIAAIALAVIASFLHRQGQSPELAPVTAHRVHHAPRHTEEAAAGDTASLFKAAAADVIGKLDIKARDVALVALVAGLVLGASPALRRGLGLSARTVKRAYRPEQ